MHTVPLIYSSFFLLRFTCKNGSWGIQVIIKILTEKIKKYLKLSLSIMSNDRASEHMNLTRWELSSSTLALEGSLSASAFSISSCSNQINSFQIHNICIWSTTIIYSAMFIVNITWATANLIVSRWLWRQQTTQQLWICSKLKNLLHMRANKGVHKS